jgi:hypothetical protein
MYWVLQGRHSKYRILNYWLNGNAKANNTIMRKNQVTSWKTQQEKGSTAWLYNMKEDKQGRF